MANIRDIEKLADTFDRMGLSAERANVSIANLVRNVQLLSAICAGEPSVDPIFMPVGPMGAQVKRRRDSSDTMRSGEDAIFAAAYNEHNAAPDLDDDPETTLAGDVKLKAEILQALSSPDVFPADMPFYACDIAPEVLQYTKKHNKVDIAAWVTETLTAVDFNVLQTLIAPLIDTPYSKIHEVIDAIGQWNLNDMYNLYRAFTKYYGAFAAQHGRPLLPVQRLAKGPNVTWACAAKSIHAVATLVAWAKATNLPASAMEQ